VPGSTQLVSILSETTTRTSCV